MLATLRRGPVGTGAYLVGHAGSWSEPSEVDVWLLALFLPLVPLSRWRVSATPAGEGRSDPEALTLTVHARSRVPVVSALLRIARAAGTALLTCALLGFGVWTAGSPWATSTLTALFGSFLRSGLLDKLGMAIEIGVFLAGAAVPVLVLMYLDERTPRVGLASVLRGRASG